MGAFDANEIFPHLTIQHFPSVYFRAVPLYLCTQDLSSQKNCKILNMSLSRDLTLKNSRKAGISHFCRFTSESVTSERIPPA